MVVEFLMFLVGKLKNWQTYICFQFTKQNKAPVVYEMQKCESLRGRDEAKDWTPGGLGDLCFDPGFSAWTAHWHHVRRW